MSKRSGLGALLVSLAMASTASAQESPRSPQRQRLQALSQRQPIPQTLCPLGELDRVEGDLTSARTHLTEGLERPFARTTTALGRKTVLFQCHLSLAQVLAAQNDLDGAWTHLNQAWIEGASLPAARTEASTSVYLTIARRRWSGDQCAATWDLSNIEAAERTALNLLARQDDAGVRACLTAIRARAQAAHRGVCQSIERLPENTAAYAPTAASWTTLAPQLGAYSGDGVFLIARTEGATTRYVACEHGLSEYSARYTGARLGADGPIALVARIEPCGEDLGRGETCPIERVAYVIDAATGTAAGAFALQHGRGRYGDLLDQPFGAVAGEQPFTLDGAVIRVGTRRLSLVRGVLVPAP
jgi:hypothetical protein